jgi:acyl carrier protein
MHTKQAIYDKIVYILRSELLFEDEIHQDTSIEALGLDSIQLMQLFVYIEELFYFEFPADMTIDRIKEVSLSQFVDLVQQSAKPPAISGE